MMEDEEHGLMVHEINNTVEFKGASSATGINIAGLIIDYIKNANRI
jgi:[lysine-biosynthesis-protein LysW]---L-2-aminoadipate ligase